MRQAEGGAKIVGVFRVKNHDFTPKNHIFQLPREAQKFLRYFVWKFTILPQKIIVFSNFRGGTHRVHPPWIRPWVCLHLLYPLDKNVLRNEMHEQQRLQWSLKFRFYFHKYIPCISERVCWTLKRANTPDSSCHVSWREQVTFQSDDDDVRFVLNQHE